MELHRCEGRFDSAQCGSAIDYCETDGDGFMWAGNGEYESQVRHCPFCGQKAAKKPENTEIPGGVTWDWGTVKTIET